MSLLANQQKLSMNERKERGRDNFIGVVKITICYI